MRDLNFARSSAKIYSRDFIFAIHHIFFYNPYNRNYWRGLFFRFSMLSRIYAKIKSSRIKSVLQYTVFRFFLLHALTYWAEILHMTFFCRTTYQVWVTSIFEGVTPLLDLRIVEIHSIPHFSLTFFDILSWNFAYVFVLLYYRLSSSVVNSYQFL